MPQIKKDVTEFFKLLIEIGDCFYVDKEMTIRTKSDDHPVLIKINDKPLPMIVFNDNMMVGKHTFFNPLVEVMGHSAERNWFEASRSLIFGVMVKNMMKKIITMALDEEAEVDYDKLDMIRPFIKKIDKKLIKEIDKIQPVRMLRIVPFDNKRTAQAQTDIFDKKYQETLSSVRKGSWVIITSMFESFLGTDEPHKLYHHKGTIIGIQKMDAFLNVMLKLTQALDIYAEVILEKDLHTAEFVQHMKHIEEYREKCKYAVTATIQSDKEAVKPEPVKAPWQTDPTTQYAQPTPQFNAPTAGVQQAIPYPGGPQQVMPQYGAPAQPMYGQQQPPQQMAGQPVVGSVPNADPMMFARMAKILESNPYMDANQLANNNAPMMMNGQHNPGFTMGAQQQMPMPSMIHEDTSSSAIPAPRDGGGGLPTPHNI
jgi:hypothetical protein